jgi:hypothetical protein
MLERRPPSALYLYLRHDGCWYWRVAAPGQALVARGYPVRAFPLQDVRSFEAAQTAAVSGSVRSRRPGGR